MRNIISIISLCFLPPFLGAQQITVEAYNDSNSAIVSDKVIIGFDSSATIGLDTELGEQDISSEPINEFSLRAIQRDQDTYDCMIDTAGTNLIYPNHIESKIDLRNPNNTTLENAYFEIVPNGVFEGGFSLYLGDYHSPENPRSYLNLATRTYCDDDKFSFLLALSPPNETPFFIHSIVLTHFNVNFLNEPNVEDIPFFKKLYIHMEQDLKTNTLNANEEQKNGIAFPNPTNGEITLDWCGNAELFNNNGQSIELNRSTDCRKFFDLDHLPAAVYFLKLSNQKSNHQMTIKLLKL